MLEYCDLKSLWQVVPTFETEFQAYCQHVSPLKYLTYQWITLSLTAWLGFAYQPDRTIMSGAYQELSRTVPIEEFRDLFANGQFIQQVLPVTEIVITGPWNLRLRCTHDMLTIDIFMGAVMASISGKHLQIEATETGIHIH